MSSLALIIIGASVTTQLAFTWPHEAEPGAQIEEVTASLFPFFLDWLEEAEGKQLEQPGRCCPVGSGPLLMAESRG